MGFKAQRLYYQKTQVVKDGTEIWFGKHKGTKMSDLPENYKKWLEENSIYENIKNYFSFKKKNLDNN
jgi:hypothetical protein